MSQDIRLTPKFRDTYAYLVHGLIKEPTFNEDDRRLYSLADPSLLETIKNQRKDSDVRDFIEIGLRPVSDRLDEKGAKTNATLILQLIKEIIKLTNFEFTAMLAGDITHLTSYSTPETLLTQIQKKGDSVISLEQFLRKEFLGRGILQPAMDGIPTKTMPLDTYIHVFELGLLRIILMLFDTFLVYSRSPKQKDQSKEGDLVSISLDLKASQEGDIPGLASEEIRKKGWNGIVQEYKIVKEGKKGFLGMGGEPNTYQLTIKLFPMRVLPEMVDPNIVMDEKQINAYVNDLIKSILWSDGFLKTGYLPNPTN